jgi:Secretion system C-terminal sorting domain
MKELNFFHRSKANSWLSSMCVILKKNYPKVLPFAAKEGVLMRKIIVFVSLSLAIFSDCSDKVETEITNNVLLVYPNPTRSVGIVVVNSNNESFTLTFFDPSGQIISSNTYNSSTQTFQIDLSDKPTGKYHVVCKVGSFVYSKSLLKI